MSKDRYVEDHFIEIVGSAGNKTLYVSDNLNVLDKLIASNLDVDELSCNDLVVDNNATFGADPSGSSAEFKVKSSRIDTSTSSFIGSVDMSNIAHSSFSANGFVNEGSINISMLGSSSDSMTAYSKGDSYIASARGMRISAGFASNSTSPSEWSYPSVVDSGDLLIQANDDVIVQSSNQIMLKSSGSSGSTQAQEINIINSAGGTSIPYGVFLGGGYGGTTSPVPTEYKHSLYGGNTNDSSSSDGTAFVRSTGSYSAWPGGSGWYPDGWVTPKLEVAYTAWSGHARARDSSGDSTEKKSKTDSWEVAVPLPTLWDSGVVVMGLTYMVRRLKNDDNDSRNRNMDSPENSGSTGSLEFVGGSMFPDYKYVSQDGTTTSTSDHGFGAYISYEPNTRDKHLVIRFNSGKTSDHEFGAEYGTDLGGGHNLDVPKLDSSGIATGDVVSVGNTIGVSVKVLLFFTRKDL